MRANHSDVHVEIGSIPRAPAGSPNELLMEAIRSLGRLPERTRIATEQERVLAKRLGHARQAHRLNAEEEEELAAMEELPAMSANVELMEDNRNLGRLPKDTSTATQ